MLFESCGEVFYAVIQERERTEGGTETRNNQYGGEKIREWNSVFRNINIYNAAFAFRVQPADLRVGSCWYSTPLIFESQ